MGRLRPQLRDMSKLFTMNKVPVCPECGHGSINVMSLNTYKRNIIAGASALFFCTRELECGWSDTSPQPFNVCLRYYASACFSGEVIDLTKIK
jgi:hypothetical protein